MARSGVNLDHPVQRIGTVLVHEVRTAAAAGSGETTFERGSFRGSLPGESEELLDLEERLRRLVVHHLNDAGVPVSATRPPTVEASPEFAFFTRGASTAVKAVPAVYRVFKSWWQARQDRFIRSFHRTAVITIDLKNTGHHLTVVSGLCRLKQRVLEEFPGINLHLRVLWQSPAQDPDTKQIRGDGPSGNLIITSGCLDRGVVVQLLKRLQKNPNQKFVVLRGWRLMSIIKFTRTWVLPQQHRWAIAQNTPIFVEQSATD
jgi:hypothetical protein